jgi:TonB family protein
VPVLAWFLIGLAASAVIQVAVQDPIRAADASVRPQVVEKRLPPDDMLIESPGKLVVEFVIERDGSVGEARVVDGSLDRFFLDDTLAHLRRWKFEAGRKDDAPVRTLAKLTVTFEQRTRPARGSPPQPAFFPAWAMEGVDDPFGAGAARIGEPAGCGVAEAGQAGEAELSASRDARPQQRHRHAGAVDRCRRPAH